MLSKSFVELININEEVVKTATNVTYKYITGKDDKRFIKDHLMEIMDLDEYLDNIEKEYDKPLERESDGKKLTSHDMVEIYSKPLNEYIVAMDDNKLIGILNYMPSEFKSSCVVSWLAVLPNYKGMGIGTQLMEQAFLSMKKKYKYVSLGVSHKNKPARALYDKEGFKPFGLWLYRPL